LADEHVMPRFVATDAAIAQGDLGRRSPAPRWTRAIFGAMAALLVAYLCYLLLRPDGEHSELIDGWLVCAFELSAGVLCLARGFRNGRVRIVPLVLGAAALSWAVGDVCLTVESIGGATPPSPSLADGFYIGFFPLAYAGILLFMRGEVRRLAEPSWLDSSIAATGTAAVCAAFAFRSVLRSAGGDALSVAVNLAYPVGDLLLLGLVVGGTAILAGRNRAPWLLLGGGMAMNAIGDTFNLFSAAGPTHVGTVFDGIAWPTALMLIALAMWLPAGFTDPLRLTRPPGFLLPGIAAIAGLAVLLVAAFHHPGPVAVSLATLTLALVGVRLGRLLGTLRALTRRRHQQAVTDQLTGIGNRRYLFDVLEGWFAEQEAEGVGGRQLAFLFIDLDRFKEINDSFGHPAGDELLRQVGSRLRLALRDGDALVRLGGDEFAVLLIDTGPREAAAIAQRITEQMTDPFELDAVSVGIGASIGIARAPADAQAPDSLVSCADLAMYRAKLTGEPYTLYEPSVDDTGNLLRLAEELREAIEGDQLVLHYQPQLDLRTGEVTAVESLLRWAHPDHGLIPPARFLPVAEQANLMAPLTRWVLDRAIAQCAVWLEDLAEVAVSVNISPSNLLDPGFSAVVKEILSRHGVPARALVLEITESCVIRDFERSKAVVEELRSDGVTVSIDDFGSGFTSLAYLSGLAVGQLKLDRAFVARLAAAREERDLRLVRSTIELGHALEMSVVAEGIEDAETLELLRSLGCDVAQGYLVGRPAPAGELELVPQPALAEGNAAPARAALPSPALDPAG
jgi:diguanylate cyclase (GGDEF)-like protein